MIHVFDKFKAELYSPPVPTVAIRCLNSLVNSVSYGPLRQGYLDILPLTFDDIVPEDKELNLGGYAHYVLFNKDLAMKIKEFVEGGEGKFQDIMVHCTAGLSRSCAVGAAIGDFYQKEYDPEIWTRWKRGPNMHVYNTLMEVLVEGS